jgi:hypothetical protein
MFEALRVLRTSREAHSLPEKYDILSNAEHCGATEPFLVHGLVLRCKHSDLRFTILHYLEKAITSGLRNCRNHGVPLSIANGS